MSRIRDKSVIDNHCDILILFKFLTIKSIEPNNPVSPNLCQFQVCNKLTYKESLYYNLKQEKSIPKWLQIFTSIPMLNLQEIGQSKRKRGKG
jgi:hypothetical protein